MGYILLDDIIYIRSLKPKKEKEDEEFQMYSLYDVLRGRYCEELCCAPCSCCNTYTES